MHCVVVGAGVVGTATALELARKGFDVDVIESSSDVALGASHANAGLISPGHSFSWAEPGAPSAMIRSVLGMNGGIGVCQPLSPALWRWGLLFAAQCTRERWSRNSNAAIALAEYSRRQLLAQPDIAQDAYGGRSNGIVYLYAPGQQASSEETGLLDRAGIPYVPMSPAELSRLDPLLPAAKLGFGGAIYCPQDGTGDAARFCRVAAIEGQELGVRFHFNESLEQLDCSGTRVSTVATSRRILAPDAVVICTGLASRVLLKPLGHRLPIYPVSGYSVTYDVQAQDAPSMGAVSVPHKIAWAHLGDRSLRLTGFADIGTPSEPRRRGRFAALESFAAKVFPTTSGQTPKSWVGQRPMTPDGLPIIGRGTRGNLWLNCGHGAMGWTHACGSARLLADLIDARAPAIDAEPYDWRRFE